MSLGLYLGLTVGNPALNRGGGYLPELVSLRDRLPIAVSAARLVAANNLFKALKATNALTNLDLMYLPIGEAGDEDNNLVNWVSDTFEASTVNAPTYGAFGWATDGATQYIESGAAHNALGHYSQNDAYMGVVCLSDVTSNSQFDAGYSAPTTYINPRSSSTQMAVRANSTSGTLAQWAIPGTATSVGFSWFTRRSSTDLYLGRNANVSTVFSQVSAALGTSTVKMMRSGSNYTTRKDSGLIVGGGITPEVGQAIGQAVVDYYATLGIAL